MFVSCIASPSAFAGAAAAGAVTPMIAAIIRPTVPATR
jgi:hypothetical protein